ncbi:MAG: MFS transporter [Burkholderiales bacterium]|nr:MFS transporter [Burkholderiales bacterium]
MRADRRNVLILAAAQALVHSASVLAMALGALVGGHLAADKALATLPIAAMVVGTALTALPAALFMRRVGRRAGFMTGAAIGLAGSLTAAFAVYAGSFALFVFGHALLGGYQGFTNYYRFAAGEAAAEDFRSRAISWVIAGGVVAAVVGPQLASTTRDLLAPHAFVGSYLAQGALTLLALAVLVRLRMPAAVEAAAHGPVRPLREIARQPTFLVALGGAAVAYAVMILVMTATPVAVVGCGLPLADAFQVIQWHVLGMFVPSFFTGALIARYGAPRIMAAGFALLAGHVAIALSGVGFMHFASGLVLLGVGWNFAYVGGTTLLTTAYRPVERHRAQAVNDFAVFGSVALASLSSGWLYHAFDWQTLNLAALPFLGAALAATLALARYCQRRMESSGASPCSA